MAKPLYIQGTFKLKRDASQFLKKKGDTGFITAFRPQNRIFSVYFSVNGHWVTLDGWNINEFNAYFKYQIFDEERRYTMM